MLNISSTCRTLSDVTNCIDKQWAIASSTERCMEMREHEKWSNGCQQLAPHLVAARDMSSSMGGLFAFFEDSIAFYLHKFILNNKREEQIANAPRRMHIDDGVLKCLSPTRCIVSSSSRSVSKF